MIKFSRKGKRLKRLIVLCLVMMLSFAGILSLRTVYAGEIKVFTDSISKQSDQSGFKLVDISKKFDQKVEITDSKETKPIPTPPENFAPEGFAPGDELDKACNMPLEIDPEEWNPTGGNSSYGDIDTDLDEDTEILGPTHPYAPYEEILENQVTPTEMIDPETGELIPLTDLEEDILYIEDVIYYEPEKLPQSGTTIEPVLENSPATGGSRNSTPWFILSILSLVGIISLNVSAKENY